MENKIMEAMSCLEPRLIQEAAQPRTHKRPNIRQVLLVACLCALIAIPVFALVSGWVVEKLPGSDSSLQAEPGLTGADFTEQQKARFRAFVREWGTKGTFSGISQMKSATGLEVRWSDKLTLETLVYTMNTAVRRGGTVEWEVYGGNDRFNDHLFTARMECLYFLPTPEGEMPSREALRLNHYGVTDGFGELIHVTVELAAKVGEDAPDIQYGLFATEGTQTLWQCAISRLGTSAQVAVNGELRSATAFFTVDGVAYQIHVRPGKNASATAETVLYDILESLE